MNFCDLKLTNQIGPFLHVAFDISAEFSSFGNKTFEMEIEWSKPKFMLT